MYRPIHLFCDLPSPVGAQPFQFVLELWSTHVLGAYGQRRLIEQQRRIK